jgi:hypothetical protein
MFACYLSDVQTECEIPFPLLLLKKENTNPVFRFTSFLLLKEGKAHMQSTHFPHNYPC